MPALILKLPLLTGIRGTEETDVRSNKQTEAGEKLLGCATLESDSTRVG